MNFQLDTLSKEPAYLQLYRKLVEDNLKKKYQENKLPILDEIIELDKKVRELKINGDNLQKY